MGRAALGPLRLPLARAPILGWPHRSKKTVEPTLQRSSRHGHCQGTSHRLSRHDPGRRPGPWPDPGGDRRIAAAGNFAAISKPNLSPILGRYYERSWSHGERHTLYDSDGRGFLDFACGIATTSLGHHHPAVTAAIKDQADKLLHICNALGYLEPVGRLAAMLADCAPTHSTRSSSAIPGPRRSRPRSSWPAA